MTIRNRLTWWYAGIVLASISLMAGVVYYELVYEREARMAAGQPREPIQGEVAEVILFSGVPIALLTVFGGGWVLRRALEPLGDLTRAAERIHADNLREPLPRTGNGDEVDRLSEVLNTTTKRLDDSFTRVREFTLHASHELKTPLTVMRSGLEAALDESGLSSRERERTLSLLCEISRLTHIVDSLTFLTKADAGQLNLQKAPLAFDELVREACEDAHALAQSERIEICLRECASATVVGDRRRLRQLLLILADNAIKYNHPQGRVDLGLRVEGRAAALSVRNTGPGISKALLGRVFDRFVRGDTSQQNGVDGCGLGLTIAKWIVETHGGTIRIDSQPDQLTTVTVSFPIVPKLRPTQAESAMVGV